MLGLYDINNMNFVQTVLTGDRVFIDVGANIGAYTLIASELDSVRVISIEPNVSTFEKLRRNIALNDRRNVDALNIGVSAAPGQLMMTDGPRTGFNRMVGDAGTDEPTIMVQVTTLDLLCAQLAIRPAVIKIDVQGHELSVLQGAKACLPGVDACLVENGESPSVIELLQGHGFQGPLYYHHRLGHLKATPQRLAEDPIFIGTRFTGQFPRIAVV